MRDQTEAILTDAHNICFNLSFVTAKIVMLIFKYLFFFYSLFTTIFS